MSATDRKAGKTKDGVSTATRNESKRAEKKDGPVLEDSETGTPSRKSTRKASGGGSGPSNLERRAVRALNSPSAVAEKASATAKRAPTKASATAKRAPTKPRA